MIRFVGSPAFFSFLGVFGGLVAGVLGTSPSAPAAGGTPAPSDAGASSDVWYNAEGRTLYTVSARPAGALSRTPAVPRVIARDLDGGTPTRAIGSYTPSREARGVGLVAAASADGRLVATCYHETIPTRGAPKNRTALRIWNGRTGELVATLPQGGAERVSKLAFSPDASLLAVAGESVRVFVMRDNTLAGELTHTSRVDVGATPAGRRVGIECLAFAPDGAAVATGGGDGCVRVWSVPGFKQVACLDGHLARLAPNAANPVLSLAFSLDGKRLVSSALDGMVKVWETDKYKERSTLLRRAVPKDAFGFPDVFKGTIQLAVSPSGDMLATLEYDRVRLWELRTGRCVAEDKLKPGEARALVFSPKGQTLTACSGRDTGRVTNWAVTIEPPGLKRHSDKAP